MTREAGQPVVLQSVAHQCVKRWNLQTNAPFAAAHISVGTLAEGDWYVDHTGFGARRFADKHAAWAAIRRLMDLHEGSWGEVPPGTELPHQLVDANGWRVLYSTSDYSLYGTWGRLAERIWDSYTRAIRTKRKIRDTRRHWERSGDITLRRYTDPRDRRARYVVEDVCGSKQKFFDHPDRTAAEERYEQLVRAAADKAYPFPWSDVQGVPLHVVKNPKRIFTTLYDGTAEYFGGRP
ncbi:hypothetical protein ACQF36_29400 [Streptomyces sp. Marseille-Q5077]|uniref:hypothetical protein n=1 Tax=Streptomyces sp. Marseille-Q5077 TaxID=3418995 RepID=UPI003D079253